MLDATGAYHEIAKKIGSEVILLPHDAASDPDRTKVLLVTLPETTPVLETANLRLTLKERIHWWAGLSITAFPVAIAFWLLVSVLIRIASIEAVKDAHADRMRACSGAGVRARRY